LNDSLTIGLLAKVANLLGQGTWVSAMKSNNFVAGTLQA